MPRITINANQFRDADDGQSLLIPERFGPAWYMNGELGNTEGVSCVPMPSDWDGDPIGVYVLGAVDPGEMELTIEALVAAVDPGNAYGSPCTAVMEGNGFRMYGPYQVTPSSHGSGDRFLGIRIRRSNTTPSTTGLAFKAIVIEYASV